MVCFVSCAAPNNMCVSFPWKLQIIESLAIAAICGRGRVLCACHGTILVCLKPDGSITVLITNKTDILMNYNKGVVQHPQITVGSPHKLITISSQREDPCLPQSAGNLGLLLNYHILYSECLAVIMNLIKTYERLTD